MKFIKFVFIAIFITTAIGLSAVFAVPGDLDPAFGKAGFLTKNLSGRERSNAVLVQPDGKFIVIGADNFLGGPVPTLIRYNPNGTLDTTFSGDGIAQTGLGQANGAALQSDGKIVVVGTYLEKSEVKFAAIRFNADGTLDTTFSGDGIFTDSPQGVADAVAIQPDGKIVVVGWDRDAFFQFDYAVVRLNTDGTLDTTFDGDGKVLTGVTPGQAGGEDKGFAVALQTDGKIIVGGESLISGDNLEFVLLRYNADGSLDTSFDTDGIVSAGFGNNLIDRLRGIAIDANGKILASGFGNDGTIQGAGFIRFNADGSFDTSFSDDGKLIVGSVSIASDVVVQPDGKILGGGGIVAFDLIRLNQNGSLDSNFGESGVASIQIFDSGNASIIDMTLDSNGNVFAAGSATNGITDDDFAVAKFSPDGTPSASFGTFGYSTSNPFDAGLNRSLVANAVAVQSNGKVLAGGTADFNNDETYGYIAQYNSNGRIDNPFGTSFNGFAMISIPDADNHEVNALAIQPDGKILVAGDYLGDTTGGTFLARFNPNGEKDFAFGGNNNGYATVSVFSGGGLGRDVFILPDGKIFVAGATVNIISQIIKPAIFKFNADGSRDTTFGTNGIATTSFSSSNDIALSLDVQADGKIVIGGGSNFDLGGANGFIALARFNSNGTLDNSFDSDGKVTTDVGTFIDTAADVKIQTDGKIVIGGASCTDGNCDGGRGLLFRYNSNGSLDTSFDGDGKIILQSTPPGLNTAIGAIALQSDGKIVASGVTTTNATQSDTLIARFNGNGSFDTSFGIDGIATSDIGGTGQFAFDVVLQTDGKIVTAGSSQIGSRTDFAVWRFLGDGEAAPTNRAKFDFDGDNKTDISIFRPAPGEWWYLKSSDGGNAAFQFGQNSDTIVPADFTGDGKTDIAFWRESSGEWFVLRSEDSSFYSFPFGTSGDIPIPGDFDGDGKADPAVFRPSVATWFILNSTGGTTIEQFGLDGDLPIAQDFDGDGKDDLAIYRPTVGEWYYRRSLDNQVNGFQFGMTGDKPVPADFTGDGKADIAFWRPSSGEWFILRSEDSSFFAFPFGINGDTPAPGDYDGDGTADSAVFRPSNNTWYLNQSTNGFTAIGFGVSGDVPLPSAFVP